MQARLIAGSLITLAAAATGVTLADTDVLEDLREMTALATTKVTLDHAVAAATSTIYPGSKLLEAEVDTNNGIPSYVIDVEKEGKHTVLVNIRTGEVKIRHGDEDEGEDND